MLMQPLNISIKAMDVVPTGESNLESSLRLTNADLGFSPTVPYDLRQAMERAEQRERGIMPLDKPLFWHQSAEPDTMINYHI